MAELRTAPEASPESEPYWDATRDRRLLLQRCVACGHFQFYPRALCAACHTTALTWVESRGRGSVYSFTVVLRAPEPAFVVPYVVALIDLDEGPRLLSNVLGEARCDQRVAVDWLPLQDGRNLPVFIPAPTEEA